MTKRRTAPVHDPNDDVGVEADHSSKKTRGSGSAGGSSGIPSGRKSLAPSASSSAQNLSRSIGCFFSGSRITLSPTLLTRTSVPSKRNSFGRRTAWLRPCLNILAVALMTRFLQHIDRYLWYISCDQRVGQLRDQSAPPRTLEQDEIRLS